MTVKISKDSLSLREQLTSLSNQKVKKEKVYLDSLVNNGDFSNGTAGWTLQIGWSLSNGVVSGNGSTGYYMYQTVGIPANTLVLASFEITSITAGSVKIGASGVAPPQSFSSVGTHSVIFMSRNSTSGVEIFSQGFNGSIDNVSVYEVGKNLVTNGTFDYDGGWTKGTGWTISGGTASKTAGTGSPLTLANFTAVVGQTYTLSFDLTKTAGTFDARVGLAPTGVLNAGHHKITLTATNNTSFYFYGDANFVGSIDNVILTEGNHQAIQSLPQTLQVSRVFINGDLAREGEEYDYTIKTDGINQWLKPTVEPTATTDTAVIGVYK